MAQSGSLAVSLTEPRVFPSLCADESHIRCRCNMITARTFGTATLISGSWRKCVSGRREHQAKRCDWDSLPAIQQRRASTHLCPPPLSLKNHKK